MVAEMNFPHLEFKRKLFITDVLQSISNYEKIEFEKRLRIILRSKSIKAKLVEKRNLLQSDFQSKHNRKTLVELKIFSFYVLLFLIIYFSGIEISNYQYISIVLLFVIIYFAYMTTSLIHSSFFEVMNSNLEFEIDRYTNDIEQYGYFITSDEDLFLDYNAASDDLKHEFFERTTNAKIELEIEILSYMNLEVKEKNGN